MSDDNTLRFSIIKLVPLTVLIGVLAQASVVAYYNFFNFSPITYFEGVELLIASTKDFIIVACYSILYLQFIHAGILPVIDIYRFKKNRDYTFHRVSFKEFMLAKLERINVLYVYTILLLHIGLIGLYFEREYLSSNTISVVIISIACLMLIFVNDLSFETRTQLRNLRAYQLKKHYPHVDLEILITVLALTTFILLFSFIRSEYVREKNPYKGTTLILDDNEKIKCTSKVIFIGKSQKFYFIYNTPDSSVRVVQRDKLKKEVIKIRSDVNFLFRF